MNQVQRRCRKTIAAVEAASWIHSQGTSFAAQTLKQLCDRGLRSSFWWVAEGRSAEQAIKQRRHGRPSIGSAITSEGRTRLMQPTKEAGRMPEVVTPPMPPGEAPVDAVRKTRAVVEALVQLGEEADAQRVADAVKQQTGLDIQARDVAAIRAALRKRAQTPPGPDQPPPENARGHGPLQ